MENMQPRLGPPLTRADGNRFIEALNERGLCACVTQRQLRQLRVPGPYLPCERHACIHPGVFARGPTVVHGQDMYEFCWTCGHSVPRSEL